MSNKIQIVIETIPYKPGMLQVHGPISWITESDREKLKQLTTEGDEFHNATFSASYSRVNHQVDNETFRDNAFLVLVSETHYTKLDFRDSVEGEAYTLLMGRYYGYNRCCSEFFELRKEVMLGQREVTADVLASIDAKSKLTGTGFIPCPDCNSKHSEAELLGQIRTNRICPEPFPESERSNNISFIAWLDQFSGTEECAELLASQVTEDVVQV